MKVKEFFNNVFHNRIYRWYFLAVLSFVMSIVFLVYNFVMGVFYRLIWNFSVSFYYLALMAIKGIILYGENRWKAKEKAQIELNRLKLFKIENVFLLLIDVALIAPITLMALEQKNAVDIGMIPTIAVATYTTYRVIMACINYTRTKRTENLALHGLKIISLKEAIVSIITLQNTMIFVFGNASDMRTLTAFTNAGMLALMVAVSVFQFIKLKTIKNSNKI